MGTVFIVLASESFPICVLCTFGELLFPWNLSGTAVFSPEVHKLELEQGFNTHQKKLKSACTQSRKHWPETEPNIFKLRSLRILRSSSSSVCTDTVPNRRVPIAYYTVFPGTLMNAASSWMFIFETCPNVVTTPETRVSTQVSPDPAVVNTL